MRKSVALTPLQVKRADRVRKSLVVGKPATVSFVKQDGTARTLAGTVVEVKGTGDKEVVTIETSQGVRSANLYRVTEVK